MLESRALKLVLASASERRRALLTQTGLSFQVLPARVEEFRRPGEDPAACVVRLSQEKAGEAAARSPAGSLILAADTAVVDGSDMLGKPEDSAGAARILRRLRGRTHQVVTGLTLLDTRADRTVSEVCQTEVSMRAYGDDELATYVASGDPLDKAGAYAIQHAEFRPVEKLNGCYANVVGLPLCHFTRALRRLDVTLPEGSTTLCEALPDYDQHDCPLYERLLWGKDEIEEILRK